MPDEISSLAKSFSALGTEWRVTESRVVLDLPGTGLCIPDLVFSRRRDKIYFEALGYQDKPTDKKMQKDSIFRVYSMTKPWTSLAAMMLVEDGKIQLPDPVSKFLPAFKGQSVSVATPNTTTGQTTYELVPAAREPTIQDLLRHTSGFTYGGAGVKST